ncbi:hypothetical protein D9613_005617 [Agrocybe pediades]|uniref:Uncharacterized protein n=1 Tax=Agrocybe pediades TaxID=84607 RepID=A0A8H4QVI3_9AGAR|nr:hypothetical protein D9613_005617 [Agrocybe pediades]
MSSPSSPWPAPTPPPTPTPTKTRRQVIVDQQQVDQAKVDCQLNSGNNIISCFPTADTVVPQHEWVFFVWNSRRPELTQTNLVDVFLFRADSQQQVTSWPAHPNPTDRAGSISAQVNDTWFGQDGFNFSGKNVSFPYYFVIIRSDKTLDGNQIPQSTFTAVQTAPLDSVVSSSRAAAAAASSSSALAASLSSLAALSSSSSALASLTRNHSASPTNSGNVQHSSSSSSFPRWAIAVIVVLGFLAIAAICILAFLILRRIRRRQQQSSSRNSMGSSSPMMPRDNNNPDMIQRYDSAGSPLLPPATLGGGSTSFAGGVAASGAGTSHDNASTISDSGGPFSGADAAIMADAFRKMLRKPDFAANPVEEGESPEKETPENEGGPAGDSVLRDQLAEEGRDIRSVSSSRGVKVETQPHEQDPGETR